MKAEIIAVGNEIVFGHTVNTNASFIAQNLEEAGVLPQYHTVVCDDEAAIKEAVVTASRRAKVVVLTGGLGPTEDDMTKEIVCQTLGMPLEVRPEELEKIEAYFEKQNKKMPANNEKQAAFPKEAQLLPNHHGTAPGCMIESKGVTYILLPGPPKEMKPMFLESVLPYLREKTSQYAKHLDIHCFGIGESALAMRVQSLLGCYEWGNVATYVGHYDVIVRITAYGEEEKQVDEAIEKNKNLLEECLGDFIIGYNDEKLEEKVANLLHLGHLKVATAESCTGGLVAATLINCSGISENFPEGVVTYSNHAKMKYLDVKKETLEAVGAVSEETAKEMAEGIKRAAGTDIGLATTGIAGPGGGTPEKPVGLVYIGIAMHEGTQVYRLQLTGSRQEVREKTVRHILFHLYQKLRKK